MIYLTSDTHFGHFNIIRYCNRPFSSVEEMDRVLIENINKTVPKTSTLYHLGDFAFYHDKEKVLDLFRQISCNDIHILLGNHDKLSIIAYAKESLLPFGKKITIHEAPVRAYGSVMFHYPIESWEHMNHGMYHFFGHTHGKLSRKMHRRLEVGVDLSYTNLSPINLNDAKQIADSYSVENTDMKGDVTNENQ